MELVWDKPVISWSTVIEDVWGLDLCIDNLLFAFQFIDLNSSCDLQIAYLPSYFCCFLYLLGEVLSEYQKV